MMSRIIALLALLLVSFTSYSQTWVDTLDEYARTEFLPPAKYHWTWQNAALLNTMVHQYEQAPDAEKKVYFDYITKAMDKAGKRANGKTPNAVASGLGMAFLLRVTGEQQYKQKADKIYLDYGKIKRTPQGGVSHLKHNAELWDDTIFMIGEYLLGMYKATGDVKYLDELALQVRIHREKLQVKEWGLWVHGWDSDSSMHCTPCSQNNWPDKDTRRSHEMWGRGNGWVIVTLADALKVIPRSNPYWLEFAGYLKEMVVHLPQLQDKATGHWYQLPVRNTEPGNYIESSCTAMFAYGILTAIKQGLVTEPYYKGSVDQAYKGLRDHSIVPEKGGLITQNVCKGTCIGDKDYYFKRKSTKGKSYAFGVFVLLGREWEE
jgi:unsaturated rhamnogalacturonyl hydrolase